MKMRLWANWEPAGPEAIQGYHLDVDRGYPRVPVAGESISLPPTKHGTASPTVEKVSWKDDDVPNLLLGLWEEAEGALLEELTDAGFHQSSGAVSGCGYCQRR